jgi:hypothetical protein
LTQMTHRREDDDAPALSARQVVVSPDVRRRVVVSPYGGLDADISDDSSADDLDSDGDEDGDAAGGTVGRGSGHGGRFSRGMDLGVELGEESRADDDDNNDLPDLVSPRSVPVIRAGGQLPRRMSMDSVPEYASAHTAPAVETISPSPPQRASEAASPQGSAGYMDVKPGYLDVQPSPPRVVGHSQDASPYVAPADIRQPTPSAGQAAAAAAPAAAGYAAATERAGEADVQRTGLNADAERFATMNAGLCVAFPPFFPLSFTTHLHCNLI